MNILTESKRYTRMEASLISGTPVSAFQASDTNSTLLSLWEMKGSEPSGHVLIGMTGLIESSFFSSLQKYCIISLVTYSPVFLNFLITVFKVIGLNCSFSLIRFWESTPEEKAFCRRMSAFFIDSIIYI